ncbi:DUF742 domain-containing protein [Streptomyces sp. BI20]|uniref:DUF742 domain-containing protein n=1 Tax=Streptomyces sp. BI20 TaxID=3403460 RepID=UPI003C70A6D0
MTLPGPTPVPSAPARPGDAPWYDEAAGRLMRPYTASGGRTRPSVPLDLLSLITATGIRPRFGLGPEHALALRLCAARPDGIPVAEVAGRLALPAVVTKVILADLLDQGAVSARAPHYPGPVTGADQRLLLAVLDGLRRKL